MKPYLLLAGYLGLISILAVTMTGWDKLQAVRQRPRIAERRLLAVALAGGALAMYLTMRLIRHKTRHQVFMTGLPLMIIVHIFIAYAVYYASI